MKEACLAALGLVLLCAVAFGQHIWEGGFLNDDWYFLGLYSTGDQTFWGTLDAFNDHSDLSRRPLNAVYLTFLNVVFTDHPAPEIAIGLLLAVVAALLLYLLLRELGIERLHAGAIAALFLLFPAADSTKFWITATHYSLAIAFYLLGTLVAIHAFRARGRRSLLLHGVSVLLFIAGIATNEIVTGPIVASVLLYLLVAARTAAIRRWAADLAICLPFVLLVSPRERIRSIETWPDHAEQIVREAVGLFGQKGIPLGLSAAATTLLVAGVVGGAAVALRRLSPSDPFREQLRKWLLVAAGAVIFTTAAYVVLLPAGDVYAPASQGVANRVNALAAIGLVALAYSIVVLAVLAISSTSAGLRRSARWVVAAIAATIGISSIATLRDHQDSYASAASSGEEILARIEESVPPLQPGSQLFTFGAKQFEDRGIPVFFAPWDLGGAVQALWRRPLAAAPAYPNAEIACNSDGMLATASLIAPGLPHARLRIPYSRGIFFFDVREGRLIQARDTRSCARAAAAIGARLTPSQLRERCSLRRPSQPACRRGHR